MLVVGRDVPGYASLMVVILFAFALQMIALGVLGEYIRQPRVNVIVTTAISTFRQVKVVGQVRQPQSLAYRDGLRVLDAILAVGGTSEFAAANRARIIRGEGPDAKEIRVRLGDLVSRGDLRHNVALEPGDVLVVPESLF